MLKSSAALTGIVGILKRFKNEVYYMYSAYVLSACFASVNCEPRTAVAGDVGEYSRGRNSFPGLKLKYGEPLLFWFAFRFPN